MLSPPAQAHAIEAHDLTLVTDRTEQWSQRGASSATKVKHMIAWACPKE